uniref:Uncharacterized protein n=1 Tax=Faecalibaculum rodentium TaxID=1702221 RepID=A0A140DTY7_9FIRM|nr:hypothetical protein AALO17_09800 [Faecalibaculum rodentium]
MHSANGHGRTFEKARRQPGCSRILLYPETVRIGTGENRAGLSVP